MMSYYTRVQMNDNFTQDMLITMILNWLETTKNKMNGLKYMGQLPYSYETDRKVLHMQYFKEQQLFAVQFMTTDNRKDAQFVVEVIFYEENKTIDLVFNKELTEQSKYIPGTNIPGLFKQLLSSEWISKDHDLEIIDKPRFVSYQEYQRMKETDYHLPIVVLTRNKKCCMSPFALASELYGIAHVICIPTRHAPIISLINYDHQHQTIPFQNVRQTTQMIAQKLVQFIYEHYSPSTYDTLISLQLHYEHQSFERFHEESLLESQHLLSHQEESFDILQELYDTLKEEYDELLIEKNQLDKRLERYKKANILVSYSSEFEKEEQLILDLLRQEVMRLDNHITYRRKDIIESILEVYACES